MNFTNVKNILYRQLPIFVGSLPVLWQILFLYVPLLVIFALSSIELSEQGVVIGITGRYLAHALTPLYLRVIVRSLGLALCTATMCLLIAYPLAYGISRLDKTLRIMGIVLLIIPFWTNFLVHIYAWFFVLDRYGLLNNVLIKIGLINEPLTLLNTPWATGGMMVYYYLPFMVLPIYSLLEKFDKRLIEASLDLGATWLQTVSRVMIPLTIQGIQAGFFLVFVPSFAEFAIPEFMGGDKQVFVGSVIARSILASHTIAPGAAFTVVSLSILFIVGLILYRLMHRLTKPRGHP
jgi:spermidine/putrescine transport system permease protein